MLDSPGQFEAEEDRGLVAHASLFILIGATTAAAIDGAGVLTTGLVGPDLNAVGDPNATENHGQSQKHLDGISENAIVGEVVNTPAADFA